MAKVALGDRLPVAVRVFITAIMFPGIALGMYFGNEPVSAMYQAGQLDQMSLSLFVFGGFIVNAIALVWLWLRSVNPSTADMVSEVAGCAIVLLPILISNGFSLVPGSGLRLMVEVLSAAYLVAAAIMYMDLNKASVSSKSKGKSSGKSKSVSSSSSKKSSKNR